MDLHRVTKTHRNCDPVPDAAHVDYSQNETQFIHARIALDLSIPTVHSGSLTDNEVRRIISASALAAYEHVPGTHGVQCLDIQVSSECPSSMDIAPPRIVATADGTTRHTCLLNLATIHFPSNAEISDSAAPNPPDVRPITPPQMEEIMMDVQHPAVIVTPTGDPVDALPTRKEDRPAPILLDLSPASAEFNAPTPTRRSAAPIPESPVRSAPVWAALGAPTATGAGAAPTLEPAPVTLFSLPESAQLDPTEADVGPSPPSQTPEGAALRRNLLHAGSSFRLRQPVALIPRRNIRNVMEARALERTRARTQMLAQSMDRIQRLQEEANRARSLRQ